MPVRLGMAVRAGVAAQGQGGANLGGGRLAVCTATRAGARGLGAVAGAAVRATPRLTAKFQRRKMKGSRARQG